MDSIRSPINNKFRKTMAMTRNRGALTSTSSSPLELSGNVGENENGVLHHTVEKKRRLDVDKTKLLEKYFEMESKLEPQRKIQLSRELDLRPRQVAVWFQNRRARWKTKRLQSDYDALKSSYINLKSNYQALLQEKQNLISQLGILNKQLQNISRGGCDEEIESAQKEITNSVSSFENPTSVMDSMSTGEDVLNTRPKYGSGIRNEGNSDHPLYGGHSHNDQHPLASLKFLPDHITALTGKSTDQGVLCGRAVNPSLTPQQFLRLDDCFLHNQQANYFPAVEDQLTVPLPWWEWP